MAKAVKITIAFLITLAIVVASGCSGTSNTTKNETTVSVQAPNLTNNTTPEYNGPMYPANTTEVNESIEEAENIISPKIENATYVKPPQPSEREASEQSYTPINFNQSNNMPVPSGSQSAYKLKIIQTNTSSAVIVNNSTQVGNPQRNLALAQNHTSSNGTIVVKHNY